MAPLMGLAWAAAAAVGLPLACAVASLPVAAGPAAAALPDGDPATNPLPAALLLCSLALPSPEAERDLANFSGELDVEGGGLMCRPGAAPLAADAGRLGEGEEEEDVGGSPALDVKLERRMLLATMPWGEAATGSGRGPDIGVSSLAAVGTKGEGPCAGPIP